MDSRYQKCKEEWDSVFAEEAIKVPQSSNTGNDVFDKGVQWLCQGSEKILDFGCGNGTLLFMCALKGTKDHIGMDISDKGIENAEKRKEQMNVGNFSFICGGIDKLSEINTAEIDAVILSNIIDNLYPADATLLLNEVNRILKENGKVLVKVNPYITVDEIKKNNIKVIKDNLLDDGLYLLNNTTEEWIDFFEEYFSIKSYEDIYYPQYNQYNRMFCFVKNKE